uniref:GYF domain-containing protein n=1 Tax=Strongyloides stercoralis TaxID=6248 RepID=A0AAF5D8J1_STRER
MSISKDAIESYINTMNDPNPKELEGNCFFSSEKRYFKSMSNTESKEPTKKIQQNKQQKSCDGEWEKVSQKFRKNVTLTPLKNNTSISSAMEQNWRDGTKTINPSDGTRKSFSSSDKYKIGKNHPMKSELDDNWRCKNVNDDINVSIKSRLPQKKENRYSSVRETGKKEQFNLPQEITENILTEDVGKDNHYELDVDNELRIKFDADPLETYNTDQGLNTNFSNSMNSYGIDINGLPNGRMPFLQNSFNFSLDSFQNNITPLDSNSLPKHLNMFNIPLETGGPTLPTFPTFASYKNGYSNDTTIDPFSRLMTQQRLSLDQEMHNYPNYNPLQMIPNSTLPLFGMNNMNCFTPDEPFTMNNIYNSLPENEIINRSESHNEVFKGNAVVMIEILPYPKWHHNREELQWVVLSVEGNQSGPYDASDLSIRFISGDLSPYIRFVIYGGPSKKWARLIDLMKTANERNPFVSAHSPRLHEEFLMVDFYYKEAGQQMNFDHWREFISSQLEKERLGIMEKSSEGRNSNLGSNIESEFSNDAVDSSVDEEQLTEGSLYQDKIQGIDNGSINNKYNVIPNEETSNWISNQKIKKNKKNELVVKSSNQPSSKNRGILNHLDTAPKTQVQKPPLLSSQKVWETPNITPDEPSIHEKSKMSFNLGDMISTNTSKESNKSVWNTNDVKSVSPVNFAETVQKKIPTSNTSNNVVNNVSPKKNDTCSSNENENKIKEESKSALTSPVEDKNIMSKRELEVWLREKLKTMKKNVDYEVFCSFIIDVEHPTEVEDYFHTYFGDSPSIKKFIKQFLEKRSEIRSRVLKAKLAKDDLSAPAQAIGFTIQTSKKNKKQKVSGPTVTTNNTTTATPSVASAPTPTVGNNNSHSFSSISSNLHIPCKNAPARPSLLSSSKNWETPNIVPDDPETHEKAPLKFNLGDLLGVKIPTNNSTTTTSSSAWSSDKTSKIITSTPTFISTNNKSKKVSECPWKTIGKNVKK